MSAADAAAAARPVPAAEAAALFADLASTPAIVLAVSGGPDSMALLMLAARWRATRKRGPTLLAVTIDHGLRPESAREANQVKRLSRRLGVPHRTLRWIGNKPATGLQEKARQARYRLLADAATKAGASHVLTAHTLDDQAETVLMRLVRGSGITGLGGMTRVSPLPALYPAPSPTDLGLARVPHHRAQVGQARLAVGEGWGGGYGEKLARKKLPPTRRASRVDLPLKGGGEKKGSGEREIMLLRPFLDVPKARLIATLKAAGIPFVDDPSNADPRFTRVRMRALMPALAGEGLGAERLALLARRMRRAEAALESAVDKAAAELSFGVWSDTTPIVIETCSFVDLPTEVGLRLLGRAVALAGNEGPVELGKLEALQAALAAKRPISGQFRRTLAGAIVTLTPERLVVERAPPRDRRASASVALTTPRRGRNKRRKQR